MFKKIDLRLSVAKHLFSPWNQKNLACCVAICISTLFHIKVPHFCPSPLHIWYVTRKRLGIETIQTQPTSMAENLHSCYQGLTSIESWPFDHALWNTDFTSYVRKQASILSWHTLDGKVDNLKQVLSHGIPFIFIIKIYEGLLPWLNDPKNECIWPDVWTGKIAMSHALTCLGFDDFMQCFLVRSSWGDQWGNKGYAYIPYQTMILDHCSDFIILDKITIESDRYPLSLISLFYWCLFLFLFLLLLFMTLNAC